MSQPTTVKKPDQQQQGEGRITAVRILGIGCRTAFQVQCWILLPCTGTEFWPAPCRYDTATQLAVESKRFSLRGFPSKNLQPPEFGNGVNFNIFSQIFMVTRLFLAAAWRFFLLMNDIFNRKVCLACHTSCGACTGPDPNQCSACAGHFLFYFIFILILSLSFYFHFF